MKRPPFCWSVKKNPTLRFDQKKLMVKLPDEPQRIFVQDNLELFHPKIPSEWISRIIARSEVYPQHTFIFLTKNPARYAEFDFPKNCWLGVTVTKRGELPNKSVFGENANLLFVSYEPLLDKCPVVNWSSWNIMGTMTGTGSHKFKPEKKWIDSMVFCSQVLSTPVFLKDNLKPIWGPDLIQEWPHQDGGEEGAAP